MEDGVLIVQSYIAGLYLFPYRTEKLSPSWPMVVEWANTGQNDKVARPERALHFGADNNKALQASQKQPYFLLL